jgi:hypothetical protein
LVIIGSFAYVAYWLTRIFQEQRAQADRTIEVLERLESRLGDLPAGSAAAPARAGARNGGAQFVATATGTMFHLADCAVVASRPNLRKVRGDESGMEPCKLCDPLGVITEA